MLRLIIFSDFDMNFSRRLRSPFRQGKGEKSNVKEESFNTPNIEAKE